MDPEHSEHVLGFSKVKNSSLQSYEIGKRYCLDPAQVADLYVYGNQYSNESSSFSFQVEKC
jgi:hypothetical protein